MFQKIKSFFAAAQPTTPTVPTRIGPTISMVNNSTVLSDADVAKTISAFQTQVDRDFAPVWETTATLKFVPKGQQPGPQDWIIYLLDNSDQAGALGYHDLTPAGNPIAKVFIKDDQKYGLSWTVTVSHELLEMLVDPYISNCAFIQKTNTTGRLYAYEVCDPIEDDSFGYKIGDVLVSNFIYPAWFESFRRSGKFDHMSVLTAPLSLAKGGYMSIFEVGSKSKGWVQITPPQGPGKRLLAKGPESRKAKRPAKSGGRGGKKIVLGSAGGAAG